MYIGKVAILISSGFVIGATVRGGRLVDEPVLRSSGES